METLNTRQTTLSLGRLGIIGVLSLFLLAACGGGGGDDSSASGGSVGQVMLSVSPRLQTVAQGERAKFTVQARTRDGATTTATLSDLPKQLDLSVDGSPLLSSQTSPASIVENQLGYFFQSGDNGETSLVVDVGAQVPPASYALRILGKDGKQTGITINVTPQEQSSDTPNETWLSDWNWMSASTSSYGTMKDTPQKDANIWGGNGKIKINGVTYEHGLGTLAPSEIVYDLGGACSRLTAVIGIDDWSGKGGSAVFQVWLDGTKAYDSGVVRGTLPENRGKFPSKTLDVDLTGAHTLELVTTNAGDGNSGDLTDWANVKITCSESGSGSGPDPDNDNGGDANVTWLSELSWTSASTSSRGAMKDTPQKDASIWGGGAKIRVNGVTYDHGLGTLAPSEIVYDIDNSCSRLTSVVGIDDWSGKGGSAIFQVWLDNTKVYDSGIVRGTLPENRGKFPSATLDVDLTGARTLKLVTTDAGDGNGGDLTNWADAKITCFGDGNNGDGSSSGGSSSGGSSSGGSSSGGTGTTADHYTLSVGPSKQSAAQGASIIFSVRVTPDGGTAPQSPGNLSLKVTGSSLLSRESESGNDLDNDKIGYYFKSADNGIYSLTFDIGANIAEGNYALRVTGDAGQDVTIDNADLTVTVTERTAATDFGIVYARVPRSTEILHITKDEADPNAGHPYYEGDPVDASFFDNLPEVSKILHNINGPGQLVWRHENGDEEIIYDCVNRTNNEADVYPPPPNGWDDPDLRKYEDVCVPMDPMVSFDGTKVAFAVYHGKYLKNRNFATVWSNNGVVGHLDTPTWAGIYIFDLTTGKLTAWPHEKGVWDTAPVWLPGGKMMFTSTRGVPRSAGGEPEPVYQAQIEGLGHSNQPILQLWIANAADGSQARNVGNQEQINALHPFVHSSGRVLFSSHQVNYTRHLNSYGSSPETVPNLWWLMSVDLRGGDLNAHLGAHNRDMKLIPPIPWTETLKVPHFITELTNGDVCVDNYYRRNNFGSGNILCWPTKGADRSPLGHEGPYPFNKPKGIYVAVGGNSGDAGGVASYVRDPAGLPDNGILFAGVVGYESACNHGIMIRLINLTKRFLKGEKGGASCDVGIYRADKEHLPLEALTYSGANFPSRSDEGAVLVVNDPHWHEFMPKPVLSYEAIYGIKQPNTEPAPSSTGNSSYSVFASADAFIGDLKAEDGWKGPRSGKWCHYQGCAIQSLIREVKDTDGNRIQDEFIDGKDGRPVINAIRFWQVLPNREPDEQNKPRMLNVWGKKLRLMGDVPLEDDGSFRAKLPPDTPFLMAGVDAEGRSIARHQAVMSLRPGEKQVCSGCHLHGPADDDTPKLTAGQPVAPTGGRDKPLEWKSDIYPMLSNPNGCASCHDGSLEPNFSAPENLLYEELTNNLKPNYKKTDDGKTRLTVPWLTRYINGFFSRESLLYWMAAGERTDGRTNDQLSNDFNFHPDHVGGKYNLNEQQLKMLSDWIEAGLYRER